MPRRQQARRNEQVPSVEDATAGDEAMARDLQQRLNAEAREEDGAARRTAPISAQRDSFIRMLDDGGIDSRAFLLRMQRLRDALGMPPHPLFGTIEVDGAGGGRGLGSLRGRLARHNGDFGEGDYESLLELDALNRNRKRGSNKEEIKARTITRKVAKDAECETCVICLEEMTPGKTVRELSCKHFFHARCADKWLKVDKTCPVCKLPITETRVFPEKSAPTKRSL